MTLTLLPRDNSAVARAGLNGSASFALRAADDNPSDGYTLEGMAAVFDSPTIINSWEGHFREIIGRGSFKKTLREQTPVMQFDHGSHPSIGSLPIGWYTKAAEEDAGVGVAGRMFKAPLFDPLREAISAQAIRGMSYRFEVIRDKWVTPEGKTLRDNEEILHALWSTPYDAEESELLTRTVQELRCPEMGPVVFPQYTETSVDLRHRRMVIDLGRGSRSDQISQIKRAQMQLTEMIKQLDTPEPSPAGPRVAHSTEVEPPEAHPEELTRSEEAETEPRVEHSPEDTEGEPREEHSAEGPSDTFTEVAERMRARMARIKEGSLL